jgi:O-antigen/teichoic acid export membrane protein
LQRWIEPRADNLHHPLNSTRTPVGHNVSANFIAKILGAAVNLACVPFYVRALGIAGYGIVGIWLTLETIANLLDLGLSATLTRELAVATAQPASLDSSRDLLRTLESIYWVIGILIGLTVIAAAPVLASHWFNTGNLPEGAMRRALVAIGVLLACRWPISLYLGGLNGLERQVFLAWVNTGFAIARHVGAVLALVTYSPTVLTFLVWQILVNAAYAGILGLLLWRALPRGATSAAVRIASLRRVWRFAGGSGAIALTAFATQDIGPVIVSKLVTIEQFGYYSLAWRVASVAYIGSIAVGTAAFPALSRLAARGDQSQLATTYHSLCQLQSVLVLPTTAILLLFGRQVIFAWTGDAALAARVYPVSSLLAAGAALQCLGVAPFALQIAYGWTSLALYLNLVAAVINVPLLFWLISGYGIFGAGVAWLIVAAFLFSLAIPLMHRRLLSNDQISFYTVDILGPMAASAISAAVMARLLSSASRVDLMCAIPIMFLVSTVAAVVSTPLVREKARQAVVSLWSWAVLRPA